MRKILLLAAFLLMPILASAQNNWPPPLILNAPPSGACPNGREATDITSGIWYACTGSVWTSLSGSGGGSSPVFFNVKAYGATGNGTTDDRASIQSAMSAGCPGSTLGVILFPSYGTYMISAPLAVPSNCYLLATGATVKLMNNSLAPGGAELIVNSDFVGGNSNITVDGGSWDGNNANETRTDTTYLGGVGFRFQNVNGLIVKNLTVVNPVSWGMQPIKITNARFENITFNYNNLTINEDGIHVIGPSSRIYIHNLMGDTYDDTVGLSANDQSFVSPIFGSITDVVIDGIIGIPHTGNSVRLLSSSNHIYNVQISNVDNTGGGTWGNITISNYGLVGAGNVQNVTITGMQSGGVVSLGCNITNLIIKNLIVSHAAPIAVTAAGVVGQLSIDGVYFYSSGTPLVTVAAGGSVADLSVDHMSGLAAGAAIYSGSGTVTHFSSTDEGSGYFTTPGLKSGLAANTDLAGSITMSGGSGSYTFSGTYTSAPICIVQDDTSIGGLLTKTVSTTTLSVTAGASDVVDYICMGRN